MLSFFSVPLSCRTTEGGAMHVALSLPRVEGADMRPWVPPEHSLVVSSGGGQKAAPKQATDDRGPASLLTLEWEAAGGLTQQRLKVCCS